MDDIALAYVTCDKYWHVWNEWYFGFMRNWDIDIPKYFLGEEKECPFAGFIEVPHESVDAKHWTKKLRDQILYIPENNILIWLDDLVMQKNITSEFVQVYSVFKSLGADSFRIMPRESRSNMQTVPFSIEGHQVRKLTQGPYMVSFHPNIFRKEYLLEVLQYDESPWDCEINSQHRIKDKNIYHVQIDGWCENTIVQ